MKLLLLCLLLMVGGCCNEEWKIVAKGCVENVVYTPSDALSDGDTVIYFLDKSTYVMHRHWSIPGKCIVIRQSQCTAYNFKIDRLNESTP